MSSLQLSLSNRWLTEGRSHGWFCWLFLPFHQRTLIKQPGSNFFVFFSHKQIIHPFSIFNPHSFLRSGLQGSSGVCLCCHSSKVTAFIAGSYSKTNKDIHLNPQQRTIRSSQLVWLACFRTVGGSWRTWKDPTQTQGLNSQPCCSEASVPTTALLHVAH